VSVRDAEGIEIETILPDLALGLAISWNLLRRYGFILMPRYLFHVYHHRTELDHEGEELADKHAAWQEATVTAGEILQGIDGKLTPDREWRMEVMDEFQNRLFALHISAEKPK
jgi:hypothetical protein